MDSTETSFGVGLLDLVVASTIFRLGVALGTGTRVAVVGKDYAGRRKIADMPIDIDEFKTASKEALSVEEGTHADSILSFLADNDDRAFTQKEIHEETGIKRGSVGAVLSRLEDAGLVRHKGRYWAISEEAKESLERHEGDDGANIWKIL